MDPFRISAESSPTDAEGDRYEVFVRLLVQNEFRVRSSLRGLLPGWHDVEEVMQEASLVAWRKFTDFEEGTSFGGWLMTIARFEAMKFRRKLARTPLVFSDEVWNLLAEDAMAGAESAEIHRDALDICLKRLAPFQRELLLKAHTPGVRLYEIAQQSGRSEQAFYKTIQRLRALLLECMTKTLNKEAMA